MRWNFVLLLLAIGIAAPSAQAQRRTVTATAVTLRGDTIRIGAGQPMLVAVFASWCRGCGEEVPELNQLASTLGARGIQVIAVSADEGSAKRLDAWLTRRGAQYPVVHDSTHALAQAISVVGVPEAFLIAGTGAIVWAGRGPLRPSIPSLMAAIGMVTRSGY